MDPIRSTANPLVRLARGLRRRKERDGARKFLVEGVHHVGEAVQAGWEIEAILYAPELLVSEFANGLLEQAAGRGVRVQPVVAGVMGSLADKDHPQGIVAVAHQRERNWEDTRGAQRLVALVAPQDPGNLGTILRTMDAAGADALAVLDGGVDVYHPTAVRASMGALFWIDVLRGDFVDLATAARRHGWQLIGTSARRGVPYQLHAPAKSWALVLGSEQKGLSDAQLSECAVTVTLPMRGRVSSLNLAVAAGLLLYRYTENLSDV